MFFSVFYSNISILREIYLELVNVTSRNKAIKFSSAKNLAARWPGDMNKFYK